MNLFKGFIFSNRLDQVNRKTGKSYRIVGNRLCYSAGTREAARENLVYAARFLHNADGVVNYREQKVPKTGRYVVEGYSIMDISSQRCREDFRLKVEEDASILFADIIRKELKKQAQELKERSEGGVATKKRPNITEDARKNLEQYKFSNN